MRHGWDGEVGRYFLVHADGVDEPVGRAGLYTGEYDNLDLAWVDLGIHPDHRRRGYGTAACAWSSRRPGRWGGPRSAGSAGRANAPAGSPRRSGSSRSRSPSADASTSRSCEPGLAERLYDEAEPQARDYELFRIVAPHRRSCCRPWLTPRPP